MTLWLRQERTSRGSRGMWEIHGGQLEALFREVEVGLTKDGLLGHDVGGHMPQPGLLLPLASCTPRGKETPSQAPPTGGSASLAPRSHRRAVVLNLWSCALSGGHTHTQSCFPLYLLTVLEEQLLQMGRQEHHGP